ncbi:antirestriction protein [Achromobacter sp. JD417]|uniref:antirestriction protein n=1 Tax=Achromobacter TaxID=222 RepID=UPI0009538544|nr:MULTISPECIES: antirestriction protein [Achromobacter]SIT04620.1 Antirestriction protein [Achromobacter sp. MFA1 R4]
MNAAVEEGTDVIQATKVSGDRRLSILPKYFGPGLRYLMIGEAQVYNHMEMLCSEYRGGYWEFFELSNGGFFMVPSMQKERVRVVQAMNGYSGEVSVEAAGIIACLFGFYALACQSQQENHLDLYMALRDFACGHAEAREILQAID